MPVPEEEREASGLFAATAPVYDAYISQLRINDRVVRAEDYERLHAFAFGDAPEWVKANATLKHRVRELEAELGPDPSARRSLADLVPEVSEEKSSAVAPRTQGEAEGCEWSSTITISVCKVCDKARDPLAVSDEPCGHDPETHRRAVAVQVVPASERDRLLARVTTLEAEVRVHEVIAGEVGPENSRLAGEVERLRDALTGAHAALQSIWTYLDEGDMGTHRLAGEACGVDLCIVCLAEGVAKAGTVALQDIVAERSPASDEIGETHG